MLALTPIILPNQRSILKDRKTNKYSFVKFLTMDIFPARYNMENLLMAIKKPSKLIGELVRIFLAARNVIVQKLFLKYLFHYEHGPGIDVMDEDWDNLIVLDACRWPEFDQNCEIDGESKPVVSKGSTSREWIRKNFVGKKFHNTVYVGGNPHMEKFGDEFYHVKKSYSKTGGEDMAEGSLPGWHPDAVYDRAIEAIEDDLNKRLIMHFMQPHSPYIGPKAEQLRRNVEKRENVVFKQYREMSGESITSEDVLNDLRAATKKGYISQDQLFEVYIENLNIALDYVRDLLSELDGKTVITADHGELLGAGRFTSNKYGHPIGVYQSELRIVPWLEIDDGDRREIYAETPIGNEEADKKVIKEQLEALGYR